MTKAKRVFRPDPKLIIGALLVIASIVGVVGVVVSVNQTEAVYVATDAITEGDKIDPAALALVEVPVAAQHDLYLGPDSVPAGNFVATRTIGAGEYIPVSAMGIADDTSAQVVVSISGALPEAVAAGTAVELWSAPPAERPGTYEAPAVAVPQAHVVRILESEQLVNSGQVEVELRIPAAELATVLTATTNGARLHVVPVYRGVE